MCGMDLKGLASFYNAAVPGWKKSEAKLFNSKETSDSEGCCMDEDACCF